MRANQALNFKRSQETLKFTYDIGFQKDNLMSEFLELTIKLVQTAVKFCSTVYSMRYKEFFSQYKCYIVKMLYF